MKKRALQQSELRRDLAVRQNFQGAPDKRKCFGKIALAHGPSPLRLPAWSGLRADQVLVSDELMTVFLKNDAGKTAPADNEHFFVVLFELFDKRDEIAVAANNNKGIDVVSRECHLQRVQR